ncbi:MAG: DUF427 domain-containing protein [Chloroflexota bacterium]
MTQRPTPRSSTVTAGTQTPPARIEPLPGQESVWDYPRPPRVEAVPERLRVMVAGVTVAETTRGLRVLETAGAPVYYFPAADVRLERFVTSAHGSFCEWKGNASYVTYDHGGRRIHNVGWLYAEPSPGYEVMAGYLAFYAGRVDEAWVGDEQATPQPGNFYGGWVTSSVVGPFKGEPGTASW